LFKGLRKLLRKIGISLTGIVIFLIFLWGGFYYGNPLPQDHWAVWPIIGTTILGCLTGIIIFCKGTGLEIELSNF